MKKLLQAAFAAGALCAVASVAAADPAVVYDAGGKFDKSFNEAAYNGMEKFKAETGIGYLEFEVQADAQRIKLRFQRPDLFDQFLVAIFLTAEPGPGFTPDGVATPAQVADSKLLVRVHGMQHDFDVAKLLLTFNERSAHQDDAVAIAEIKLQSGTNQQGNKQEHRSSHQVRHPLA